MAKLTSKARNKLPPSDFAGPGRTYPDEDRSHAADAKARAQQQFDKGNMSPAQKAIIDVKANRVLKGKKGGGKGSGGKGAAWNGKC